MNEPQLPSPDAPIDHLAEFTVRISARTAPPERCFDGRNAFYRIVVESVPRKKHLAIESAPFAKDDRDERRAVISAMMNNLEHVLSREAFPGDTLIYDQERGADGSLRLTNPHYPDERA